MAAKGNKNGPSGAAVFFGADLASNISVRVPGPGRMSADRARLFAIHESLRSLPSDKSLVIFCTSKRIIRQLCYSAASNTALGWPGASGDIFKAVVKLLAARHAETRFVYVDSKENNPAKREAYTLAKNARTIPGHQTSFEPNTGPIQCMKEHLPTPNTGRRKVTTALEKTSVVKPKPWATGEDTPDKDADRSHRGRAKVHALQFALRSELLGCKTPKEFWDFVRKRTDPRPKNAKVTVAELSVDFEARLNYPPVVPSSFNADQLAFNGKMAKDLRPPPDLSPRLSYTRDITIEEIEAMKRHIKAHGIDTAAGVDGFSHEDCMLKSHKVCSTCTPTTSSTVICAV